MAARDFVAKHRPDRTVHVANRQIERHGCALLERVGTSCDELVVEGLVEAMVLLAHAPRLRVVRDVRLMEDRREIESLGLPMFDGRLVVEPVDAPNHVVHGTEPELGHVFTDFLRDEAEEILHKLGLAGELLAEHRILCGHAHRAGIQVAHAHHHAPGYHERRGGKAELLSAHQRGDGDIAAGLQLAVDLHDDAIAQAVQHQHLMGLGEPELPRHAAMLDGRQRRGARATVMARDEHHVGVRFRHARRDRTHTGNRHELDMNPRLRICVLQVVNELG